MADDPSKRGTADRSRINVNQPHEVRHWTNELGVTEQQLKEAVQAAGMMTQDVRRHLAGKRR